MNLHPHFLAAFLGLAAVALLAAVDGPKESKDEQVTLESFTHEFFWVTFSLSKESPMSPDGRYCLKKVNRDGSVKLVRKPSAKNPEMIVVKPMPAESEKGKHPPTIVVVESDAGKQTATLKELRMK